MIEPSAIVPGVKIRVVSQETADYYMECSLGLIGTVVRVHDKAFSVHWSNSRRRKYFPIYSKTGPLTRGCEIYDPIDALIDALKLSYCLRHRK